MAWSRLSKRIKWVPLPRSEKAEALCNPYCGLYTIYRFFADRELMYPDEVLIEEVPLDPTQQLYLVEINLIHFNDSALSEAALTNIRRIFKHFSSHGKQMILRFLYDWEGKGIISEPRDAATILHHMEQLSPALKEYTAHIYIIQGLFIGSWGEMHNSRYLSERYMSQLAKKLYLCSGEQTQIALRCPSFWRMIFRTFQPLEQSNAFDNSQKARFSLFNDGIMASESDFGTYGAIPEREARFHSDKWTRTDELHFQNQLGLYVSNGGEVLHPCELNDAENAIDTLKTMRVSYLHRHYDEAVLNKWKSSKAGVSDPLWKDKTAFEYIAAHLGYRFTLDAVNLAMDTRNKIRVSVKLINTGFSPCYHKFDVQFIIRTASYSETLTYPVASDTRFWFPDEKIELEALFDLTDLKQHNYILCLRIFDTRTMQPIRIANTFSAADHSGSYRLGNIITTE
jgi:hypothetical protein